MKVKLLIFLALLSFGYSGDSNANSDKSNRVHNNKTKIETFSGFKTEISVLTKIQANELFDLIIQSKSIENSYNTMRCYDRAHWISLFLEDRGILTAKAFLFGNLLGKSPKIEGGSETWWNHVAPIIIINNNGFLEKWAIDPLLFDHLAPLDEWKRAMLSDSQNKYPSSRLLITTRFQYRHPEDKSNRRTFLLWSQKKFKRKQRKKYNAHEVEFVQKKGSLPTID